MLQSVTQPRLATNQHEVREAIAEARRRGATIGLVPTMGALHEGHLSLVRASKAECSFTAVTIFVNPTQFGPGEDFQQYPRPLERDLELLAEHDVELVFAPGADELYPPGFSTYVLPPRVALPLEGRCRPDHFRGVTTIVLKLFHLVPADVAYFGQKDYQQSLVVRRMAADLNVPIEIRVCPIVREPDGLAMSSRNVYLSPSERVQALALSRSLELAADLVGRGERSTQAIRHRMQTVFDEAGIEQVDYIAVVDAETLADVSEISGATMALVAARVGPTRLIDNRRIF